VVHLQVVGDAIIRVQATSENQLPQKPQSLMVVEQTARPKYTVNVEDGEVRVSTSRVQAVVSKQTGRVRFFDAQGNSIVSEARDGKTFAPYRVPDRSTWRTRRARWSAITARLSVSDYRQYN
jgi:alpha-D-xyloside xylohydrolase